MIDVCILLPKLRRPFSSLRFYSFLVILMRDLEKYKQLLEVTMRVDLLVALFASV
jgi:hypothetical protein